VESSTIGTAQPPRRHPPAWTIYLLAGSVAICCYYGVAGGQGPAQRLAEVVLYCAVSLSAAVALIVGQRRHLTTRRAPWLLLAGAQVV
jgi:two-component system, cell cycle response regulator